MQKNIVNRGKGSMFQKVNYKNTLICLLFLYLFFTFYIRNIFTFHFLSVNIIIASYIIYNYNILFKVFNRLNIYKNLIFVAFFLWYICCGLSLLIPLIKGTYDFSYIYTLLKIPRFISISLFLMVILYKFDSEKFFLDSFFIYFINSCVIYVLITSIMIIYPEFKEFWFSIIQQIGGKEEVTKQTIFYSELITRCGLRGFSGLDCGFYCSFSIMMVLYFIIKFSRESKKVPVLLYIQYFILLLGNFYYSRTSLIVSIISSCVFLLYFVLRDYKRFFKGAFLFILVSTGIFSFMSTIDEINSWWQWSTGPLKGIYDYFIDENTSLDLGPSGEALKSMYDFKIDYEIETFLFGEGKYLNSNGNYFREIDVGIFRGFFFFGAIGIILLYLSITILFLTAIKVSKEKEGIENILLISMLFFSCFFLELKGEGLHYHMAILFPVILLRNKIEYFK